MQKLRRDMPLDSADAVQPFFRRRGGIRGLRQPPQSPHGMGQAPQLIYARGHSRARVRAQGCPEHSASTAGVYAQSGVRAKKLCRNLMPLTVTREDL